jgi:hypothetical protein
MIQPKYSPEEALEKIKLMMKYDSSKTLNENKETIFEQDYLTPTTVGTGAAAGLGAAAGGAALAQGGAGLATTITSAGGTLGLATTVGGMLPGVAAGTGAAAVAGMAVLGGAAALALIPLVIWYADKDDAKPKVERIFNYCKTDFDKISKVPRKLQDTQIRDLSDQLYDAMAGAGTDEESVYSVFKQTETASDVCALVNRFNKDYSSEGDLLEWLDDDFDASSEWEQIYRPIRNAVEDTLLTIKDDEVPVPGDEEIKKKRKSGSGGYKPCSGTYSYGCKSDVIAKVQGCLGGLLPDGKYGPKTKAKLQEIGYNSFSDADVDKICSKSAKNTTGYEDYKTDEIEVSDVTSNTDAVEGN